LIVHSDSALRVLLAMRLMVAIAATLAISTVLVIQRGFRAAARLGSVTLGIHIGWPVLVGVVSAVAPQTIVRLGDSDCEDIPENLYRLKVRLFSDADTETVGFGAVSLYLQDDRGAFG